MLDTANCIDENCLTGKVEVFNTPKKGENAATSVENQIILTTLAAWGLEGSAGLKTARYANVPVQQGC